MTEDPNGTEWKFTQPRNEAVFTTRQVVREGYPILRVTHDEDDGAWQFLCGTTNDERDAMVVGLENIVSLDPTLVVLADLPLGWVAWREMVGAPWIRQKR